MDNLSLCCPLSFHDQKAIEVASKLQANPIHIFWWRRCENNARAASRRDVSPFPREWSENFTGKSVEGANGGIRREFSLQDSTDQKANLLHSLTDDSSVYSTMTQENRAARDEFGYCRLHPHVQLAKRRQTNRFSKIFTNSSHRGEEWVIIRQKCPECEQKRTEARERTNTDADRAGATAQTLNISLYSPIPASITLMDGTAANYEGNSVLRVRTEPTSIETIQTISCQTPDGVLDCVIPCDCNGNELETEYSEYQIMERYIPLTSIDHVSRGGDAWDVLRQSTGEDDMGCKCDVKIHGFSDRVLRFDVVNFDEGENDNTVTTATKHAGIRYSYVVPDFMTSIKASTNSRTDSLSNNQQECISTNYSTENVISDLNYLVLSDREQRKSGIEYLVNNVSSLMDEVCGLGTPTDDKDASNGRSDRLASNGLV